MMIASTLRVASTLMRQDFDFHFGFSHPIDPVFRSVEGAQVDLRGSMKDVDTTDTQAIYASFVRKEPDPFPTQDAKLVFLKHINAHQYFRSCR